MDLETIEQWIDVACAVLGVTITVDFIPYDSFREYAFMQRALVGLLLIAPLCSTIGIQVVNFRLAFFAEAIGHSAFTGIALGFLLSLIPGLKGLDPSVAMIGFGILVALLITWQRRSTELPSDTIVGVFSSTVVAVGLAVIMNLTQTGRIRNGDVSFNDFLMGNILTISSLDLAGLLVFFVATILFQAWSYNRLMFIGIHSPLAQTMGVRVVLYEYLFAVLLALVVMFSIKAVGVLLVTSLLVLPAAAARGLARSAGGVFWWGAFIASSSSLIGLVLSDIYSAPTGASVVIVAAIWCLAAGLWNKAFRGA